MLPDAGTSELAVDALWQVSSATAQPAPKRYSKHPRRNLLLTVCLAHPLLSSGRHTLREYQQGCEVLARSFFAVNSVDDLVVLTVGEDWVSDEMRALLGKSGRRGRLFLLGTGPYRVAVGLQGELAELPLTGSSGRLSGNCLRHAWVMNYLERQGAGYGHVMFADGSDVFFQRDPFEIAARSAHDLTFFQDRGDLPGEGLRYFRERTRGCLSADFVEAAERRFGGVYANGGLLLGTAEALRDLSASVVQRAWLCGKWASDQGLINAARYDLGAVYRIQIFPELEKAVGMKHYMSAPKSAKLKTCCGALLARAGASEPLFIIHQYQPFLAFYTKALALPMK